MAFMARGPRGAYMGTGASRRRRADADPCHEWTSARQSELGGGAARAMTSSRQSDAGAGSPRKSLGEAVGAAARFGAGIAGAGARALACAAASRAFREATSASFPRAIECAAVPAASHCSALRDTPRGLTAGEDCVRDAASAR
jgi:hypothetical protein